MADEIKKDGLEDSASQGPEAPTVDMSSVQVPAQAVPAAPAETVTLTRETFDELMRTVGDIKTTQDAMLEATPKNEKNEIERLRAGGRLVKSVKLREVITEEGGKSVRKLVLGWQTVKNEVYIQEGKLIEDQTIKVWFEDETSREYRLRDWVSSQTYIPFEVLEESRDANGTIYFTIRKDDGKEVKISSSFVN